MINVGLNDSEKDWLLKVRSIISPKYKITKNEKEEEGGGEDLIEPVLEVSIESTTEKDAFNIKEQIVLNVSVTNISTNYNCKNINLAISVNGREYTGTISPINKLAAGGVATRQISYIVSEDDILAHGITFSVIATGTVFGKQTSSNPAELNITVADPGGHIMINMREKTRIPDGGFKLYDTIEYAISVENDGNLTITDLEIYDELTEDNWEYEILRPGEKIFYYTSYTVQEHDILNGEVINVVSANGSSPDPDEPDVLVEPGECNSPIEDPHSHLDVSASITTGGPYEVGQTIYYDMTVKNDGNLTLTDINVGGVTINDLPPSNNILSFTNVEYTLTSEDITNNKITIAVTAIDSAEETYTDNIEYPLG